NTPNQQTVGANFTLAGDAADTNALKSLVITATLDGADKGQVFSTTYPGATNTTQNWTWTKTVDTTGNTDDGLWVYTITATDIAQRTTVVTRTILVDTTKPVVTGADAFSDPYYTSTIPAGGTASDANGSKTVSGLSKVEYSLDDSHWFTVTGLDSWAKTVDISALAVGTRTVWFRATDKTGNVSAETARTFTVDRAAPTISEATYASTVYVKADMPFTVDLSDDLSLSTSGLGSSGLGIALKVNGTTEPAPSVTLGASTTNTQHVTFTVPKSYGDGIYQVTLTATDGVGKTTTLTRTINVDTTPPSVVISNLNNADLLTANAFTVLGTATDGAGSGIQKIQYQFDGGSWTDTTGTVNWAAALSSLTDGLNHTIVFQAIDNSGNTSDASTLAARTRTFQVDLALPNLTETTSTIPSATLVYKKTAVTLGGASTDANGITKVAFTVVKDGSPLVVPDDTSHATTWSYSIPFASNGSQDGIYEVTVTATDGAGRTSSISRKVQIDTQAPTLTISSPVSAEVVAANTYKIAGQVTDNGGKGVTLLEYSKDSTNGGDGNWTGITLSGLNWSVSGVDFSGTEGSRTLWVRASDGLNPANAQSVTFQYDTAPPNLSEGTINTSAQVIRAANFSLGGSVSDSNAVQDLKITATLNGASKGTVFSTTSPGAYNYPKTVDTATHT
ncbi:MAG TPA: hypothetical protein VMB23_05755, partial [Spirochaetia bacterium]|nr:hypothetical protein [Spirochaetia bacterium]